MESITAEEFSHYCGPQAVAAVADYCAIKAAIRLRAIADSLGEPPEPAVSRRALAQALVDWGLIVESWDVHPGGWRRGLVDPARQMSALDVHGLIAGVREINSRHESCELSPVAREAANQMRQIAAARTARRALRSLTVDEWLRRFPRCKWVLTVAGHILAARGGWIIAGGDTYGDRALRSAWRVSVPFK
jgi:hypothetical protein